MLLKKLNQPFGMHNFIEEFTQNLFLVKKKTDLLVDGTNPTVKKLFQRKSGSRLTELYSENSSSKPPSPLEKTSAFINHFAENINIDIPKNSRRRYSSATLFDENINKYANLNSVNLSKNKVRKLVGLTEHDLCLDTDLQYQINGNIIGRCDYNNTVKNGGNIAPIQIFLEDKITKAKCAATLLNSVNGYRQNGKEFDEPTFKSHIELGKILRNLGFKDKDLMIVHVAIILTVHNVFGPFIKKLNFLNTAWHIHASLLYRNIIKML
jgi:hypothetical protein